MTGKIKVPAIWAQVWDLISAAPTSDEHPYRTAVLGNLNGRGGARLRSIVLRDADRDKAQLTCYTDRRSVKARQLLRNNRFTWLFWDPETQLQFTASGVTTWQDAAVTHEVFAGLPKHGRKAYATELPPATPLPGPASGLPIDWADRELEQTDYAEDDFGILITHLEEAEVLHLDRKGSRRLTAGKETNGEWTFTWVVP